MDSFTKHVEEEDVDVDHISNNPENVVTGSSTLEPEVNNRTTVCEENEESTGVNKGTDLEIRDCKIENDASTQRASNRPPPYEVPMYIRRLNVFEEVHTGGIITFECQCKAFPKPSIRWYKDDNELTNTDSLTIDNSSSDIDGTLRLTITDAQKIDEGAYKCKLENQEGVAATTGYLSVTADAGVESVDSELGSLILQPPLPGDSDYQHVEGDMIRQMERDNLLENIASGATDWPYSYLNILNSELQEDFPEMKNDPNQNNYSKILSDILSEKVGDSELPTTGVEDKPVVTTFDDVINTSAGSDDISDTQPTTEHVNIFTIIGSDVSYPDENFRTVLLDSATTYQNETKTAAVSDEHKSADNNDVIIPRDAKTDTSSFVKLNGNKQMAAEAEGTIGEDGNALRETSGDDQLGLVDLSYRIAAKADANAEPEQLETDGLNAQRGCYVVGDGSWKNEPSEQNIFEDTMIAGRMGIPSGWEFTHYAPDVEEVESTEPEAFQEQGVMEGSRVLLDEKQNVTELRPEDIQVEAVCSKNLEAAELVELISDEVGKKETLTYECSVGLDGLENVKEENKVAIHDHVGEAEIGSASRDQQESETEIAASRDQQNKEAEEVDQQNRGREVDKANVQPEGDKPKKKIEIGLENNTGKEKLFVSLPDVSHTVGMIADWIPTLTDIKAQISSSEDTFAEIVDAEPGNVELIPKELEVEELGIDWSSWFMDWFRYPWFLFLFFALSVAIFAAAARIDPAFVVLGVTAMSFIAFHFLPLGASTAKAK